MLTCSIINCLKEAISKSMILDRNRPRTKGTSLLDYKCSSKIVLMKKYNRHSTLPHAFNTYCSLLYFLST